MTVSSSQVYFIVEETETRVMQQESALFELNHERSFHFSGLLEIWKLPISGSNRSYEQLFASLSYSNRRVKLASSTSASFLALSASGCMWSSRKKGYPCYRLTQTQKCHGSSHTAGCCCASPVSTALCAGAKGTGAIGTAPTAGAFAFFGGPGFLFGSPGCLFLFLAAPVPSTPASDPA